MMSIFQPEIVSEKLLLEQYKTLLWDNCEQDPNNKKAG